MASECKSSVAPPPLILWTVGHCTGWTRHADMAMPQPLIWTLYLNRACYRPELALRVRPASLA
jgi:hypothetical protein